MFILKWYLKNEKKMSQKNALIYILLDFHEYFPTEAKKHKTYLYFK